MMGQSYNTKHAPVDWLLLHSFPQFFWVTKQQIMLQLIECSPFLNFLGYQTGPSVSLPLSYFAVLVGIGARFGLLDD